MKTKYRRWAIACLVLSSVSAMVLLRYRCLTLPKKLSR